MMMPFLSAFFLCFAVLGAVPPAAVAQDSASGTYAAAETVPASGAAPVLDRASALTFASVIRKPEKFSRPEEGLLVTKVMKGAGRFVQGVGSGLGGFLAQRQEEQQQRKLAEIFYRRFWASALRLGLAESQNEELLRRVESFYLEEERKGSTRFDAVTFREMPDIMRMMLADMRLEEARDGVYETYYPDGRLRERWNYAAGQPDGTVMAFYPDGEVRTIDHYEKGVLIKRYRYSTDGDLESTRIYPVMPETSPDGEEKD